MTDFDNMFAEQPADEIVTAEGKLADAGALKFILGGNAYFTLVSKRTGTRFTYRVSVAKDKPTTFFVSVLNGPDNWQNYAFFGMIFTDKEQPKFVYSRKSAKVSEDAPSVRAFAWAFEKLQYGFGHDQLEVYHSGKCGRCGRMLTVPESIASGFGPECIGKV